jgi:hypothetical protein
MIVEIVHWYNHVISGNEKGCFRTRTPVHYRQSIASTLYVSPDLKTTGIPSGRRIKRWPVIGYAENHRDIISDAAKLSTTLTGKFDIEVKSGMRLGISAISFHQTHSSHKDGISEGRSYPQMELLSMWYLDGLPQTHLGSLWLNLIRRVALTLRRAVFLVSYPGKGLLYADCSRG